MSSSRKDALKKSRQMDTHRQMDSSLSFPVLRLQGSPRHLNSGPQHSPSPSLQDSTNPRTYWNTVLSQSSPSESASAPRPRPSEAGSSTQPVNFELDPNFKAYGMSSSLNRKRSNCLGLMIDPVPDTRRSTASRPFGCHLCKGRFERIGHLNAHVDAVHNARQPYKCHYEHCGKAFSHKSSLYRHVRGIHERRAQEQASATPSTLPFKSQGKGVRPKDK
ncbi:hypothetical protein BWQ96_06973 [Gracilariopsis chorda]|uniref:C2H2-type domain-containing protein n=1 Tax=Gracilariopsis chorda TaxID=448386 RepID=A0A2V3IMG8_9FLOR|nr:hypothetical protein BWQ96_06973 [Gracilariopsis chorda]|eukprot:PXF43276.1 hypothetical protein BWQ96_06973 [Gracilariopsis chorda]